MLPETNFVSQITRPFFFFNIYNVFSDLIRFHSRHLLLSSYLWRFHYSVVKSTARHISSEKYI